MLIENAGVQLVRISDIIVKDRQRKEFGDIEGLASSISRIGLLNPIIIDREMKLRAGERRLRAYLSLDWQMIPARFVDELSPDEARLIELEENTRRKDFEWQEECSAFADYHFIKVMKDPDWTIEQTAVELGRSSTQVWRRLTVAKNIHDPLLKDCKSLREASNILQRKNLHSINSDVAEFIDSGGLSIGEDYEPDFDSIENPTIAAPKLTVDEVVQADFFNFASSYNGPPFSFIHMDPPYGISHQNSDQGGSSKFVSYQDDEEIYWKFLSTLINYRDRLMSSQTHVMLWFSMKFYSQTIQKFKDELNNEVRIDAFPLIWYKSDGSGIVPDHMRGGRRVYETALILSFGDRKTFSPIDNVFPYPLRTNRQHLSEKPTAMLAHFFRMFVDSNTRFLDPCCGGGTSLAAAHQLKAPVILGLDIEPHNVEIAKSTLALARAGELNALSPLDSE